jgi:hypothetical protein
MSECEAGGGGRSESGTKVGEGMEQKRVKRISGEAGLEMGENQHTLLSSGSGRSQEKKKHTISAGKPRKKETQRVQREKRKKESECQPKFTVSSTTHLCWTKTMERTWRLLWPKT